MHIGTAICDIKPNINRFGMPDDQITMQCGLYVSFPHPRSWFGSLKNISVVYITFRTARTRHDHHHP